MPPKSLNKSILIVGGTSGMGLSAAIACKEAGASLVVVGRDAESAELARPQRDVGFTFSCAAYYARENIRFNVVAAALVETPMAQRAARDETILKFLNTKQPLDGGRIGLPADLDEAVLFFLSDGSRFIHWTSAVCRRRLVGQRRPDSVIR
jgi:NAD(P)-dependent dehydrogenase (short-subunit alcohol dehydrogenase family)